MGFIAPSRPSPPPPPPPPPPPVEPVVDADTQAAKNAAKRRKGRGAILTGGRGGSGAVSRPTLSSSGSGDSGTLGG